MLDRVLELTMLLGRDSAEQLERIGLTESRAHVLWELGQRGPCKQQALAAALRVSPRTITSLIDGLVETGFVTREPHPRDRRASLVTFTPQGKAASRALKKAHRQLARQLFGDLPAGHLDGFEAGLGHVLERLRSHLQRPGDTRLPFALD